MGALDSVVAASLPLVPQALVRGFAKPPHLGLKLDKEFCYQNMRRILEHAKLSGNFMRMDMEDSPCIDETLELYYRLREDFDNVGVVIQARMRRGLADVRKVAAGEGNVGR